MLAGRDHSWLHADKLGKTVLQNRRLRQNHEHSFFSRNKHLLHRPNTGATPALLNWLENLIKTRKKIYTVSVTPPQAVSEMLAWPGLGPHVAGGSLVLVQWSVSRQLTRTLVCWKASCPWLLSSPGRECLPPSSVNGRCGSFWLPLGQCWVIGY